MKLFLPISPVQADTHLSLPAGEQRISSQSFLAVLVVEDDPSIMSLVSLGPGNEGYIQVEIICRA